MNVKPTVETNPLLRQEGLPRYDEIAPEHVEPGVRAALARAGERLDELEGSLEPTREGLLDPLERLDLVFEYAWRPVVHLMTVKNSDALRRAHDAVLGEVVAFGLRLRQSRPVYDGLKALREGARWEALSPAHRRWVEQMLQAAEHAGVGLEGAAKARFVEIEQRLSKLSTDFSNRVLDARKAFELLITDPADAQGWPQSLRQGAAQSYNQAKGANEATPDAGPWRVTLDYPSFVPFMQHAPNRAQRERVYKAFVTTASDGEFDNTEAIAEILALRKEKARLLGYGSHAELSLAEKMAGTVEAVEAMFEQLVAASQPHARRELEELEELAGQPLAHWDLAFWAERLRERRFDYTDDELRPYFPLPRVLDGLFSLCQRLFGIQIRESGEAVPAWHPDVRYYHVHDERGEPIASFYLDPYSRPAEKRGGAWMDNCLKRRRVDGRLRRPVVHMVCNGTPPVGDRPSMMGFDEVITLFHEFGHGLQGMLTTVDVAEVSGANGVEWDAIEIASQFMENWCYHKPTLLGMTAHVDTGAPLPDSLFDKLDAARTFRAGTLMLRQLRLGMTDMALHHAFDPDGEETPNELQLRIGRELGPMPPYAGDRFLCAFAHIFAGGYAAGYYSYKWAELLSADAFAAFEEAGLDDEGAVAELGRKFRDTVLALGGSRHPMEVYVDFRGRQPTPDALLRHTGLA